MMYKEFPNIAHVMWEEDAWLLHTKFCNDPDQKLVNVEMFMDVFLNDESVDCGHTVLARSKKSKLNGKFE